MNDHLLLYVLYGLVTGFSEFTPISASAHQTLFPMLLRFDSTWPMLRFGVHIGALAAFVWLYWQRLTHIRHELQLVSQPPRKRNRPPDMNAVLEASLAMMALIPIFVGCILSIFVAGGETNLFLLSFILIGSGLIIYVPDFIPGGDRKHSALSRLEGLLLGFCAGCSVLPGFSGVGLMLSVGLLLKCDRSYLLDLVLLIFSLKLAGSAVVDLICIPFVGFGGFSFVRLLGCLLATMASFGGAIGAILMMRFLSVKTGFSSFAFYSWGLGIFSFILYLMI